MPDSVSWLRLYHSILDNRKTGSLSRLQFGQYITLLLLASRNKPRGVLPDYKTIGKHLGSGFMMHRERVDKLLIDFRGKGLVDKQGESWVVHNFSTRQWLSDRTDIEASYLDANNCDAISQTDTKVDSVLTLCQHSEYIPNDDNKGVIGFESIETCITDTDKDSLDILLHCSYIIKGYIQSLSAEGRLLVDRYRVSAECYRESLAASPAEDDDGFRLTGCQSSSAQKRRILADKLAAKRSTEYLQVTELWNSLPGLMHHKAFNGDDKRAFEMALERFTLPDIKTAIERYSVWRTGAAEGCYREAFKWSFCEFLSRHKGEHVKRLSAEDWESTCKPFNTGKRSAKKPTTAELLALAEKRLQSRDH